MSGDPEKRAAAARYLPYDDKIMCLPFPDHYGCHTEVHDIRNFKCECGHTFADIVRINQAYVAKLETAFDVKDKSEWFDQADLKNYFVTKDKMKADEADAYVEKMAELVELMDQRYYRIFVTVLEKRMQRPKLVASLIDTMDDPRNRDKLKDYSLVLKAA